MTERHPDSETNGSMEQRLQKLRNGTDRRTVLQLVGATSAAAIAGCSTAAPKSNADSSSEDTDGDKVTVTATPTASESQSSGPNVEFLADEATVEMVTTDDGEFVFTPRVVCIKPGGTVHWQSKQGVHTASAYHPQTGKPLRVPDNASSFDSGLIPKGKSFSHTFEEPGVYNYYCMPHESNGMVGAVVVGDPDPSNEPGLSQPQDVLPSQAKKELDSIISEVETQLELPIVADVSMRTTNSGYTFTPDLVNVRCGGAVRWTSRSGVHTATAYHPGNGEPQRVPDGTNAWSSDLISKGQTYTVALQRTGVYDYYCMPHEGNGMVGSIVIGKPTELDSEPGLAEPQDIIPKAASDRLSKLNEQTKQQLNSKKSTPTPTPTNQKSDGSQLPDPKLDGYLDGVSNFDGSVADKTGQDSVTIEVGASGNGGNYAFGPAAVYVDQGTTVTWKWTGKGGSHSVVAKDGSFESKLTSTSGHTFEHTFDSAGTYKYYCMPHKALGMKGAIVVTGGSDGSSGQQSSSSDKPTTKQDSVSNYEFSPAVIHIEPGDTVEWKIDQGMHSITAYHPDNNQPQRIPDGAASFDSGMLSSGKTFEHTFEKEGVYDYFCTPHHAMGMVGTVVVGSPSQGEPGLKAPQSSLPSKAASKLESLNKKVRNDG